jgi:ribosomal protein S18 acetylase RimI-like enzyme
MEHILDNPAYNALATGNKQLTKGTEQIKYFDKEVAPFAGFKHNNPGNFKKLHELISRDNPLVFISPVKIDIPAPWQFVQYIKCFQMIYNGKTIPVDTENLVVLTDQHILQMLALTKLTNPGPFAARTIEFGHYRGIFDGGQLVAMAGQRMHPSPYAEISAVCTHPDYTGRGFAKQLLQYHINRIKNEGNIPFLHVKCENERAIKVYENMGFDTRTELHFYIFKK